MTGIQFNQNASQTQRDSWNKILAPFDQDNMPTIDRVYLRVAAWIYAIEHMNPNNPDCQWTIFASCYSGDLNFDKIKGYPKFINAYKIIQNHYAPMENK